MTHVRAYLPLLAAMLSASPAAAQYGVIPSVIGSVVGNMVAQGKEADCMRGTPQSASEVAEARNAATPIMAQYFAAAQSGAAKSSAFHLDKKTSLTVAGTPSGMVRLDAVTDPLARRGNALADRPLRFFRSGMDAAALGQWAVQGPNGTIAGVYTALFVRKAQAWKLRELAVAVPGEKVAPAMQFCHAPGDVATYRLQSATFMREQGEKRLAKAQERLAETGRNVDPADTARRRSALGKREAELAEARSAEQRAREENRTIERLTVDAADAKVLASG